MQKAAQSPDRPPSVLRASTPGEFVLILKYSVYKKRILSCIYEVGKHLKSGLNHFTSLCLGLSINFFRCSKLKAFLSLKTAAAHSLKFTQFYT